MGFRRRSCDRCRFFETFFKHTPVWRNGRRRKAGNGSGNADAVQFTKYAGSNPVTGTNYSLNNKRNGAIIKTYTLSVR